MDIHPPEHPIRSVRDFLLQIFTVTCGIIIALALEGVVLDRRDAQLIRETRADFTAELAENVAKVQGIRASAAASEAWLDKTIEWGEARQEHKPAKNPPDTGPRSFLQLRNAAWETALATQALRLLTFSETRALATAYNHQAAMNDLSIRAREQWISLSAFGFDPDRASDADLHDALRQLRIASAYQHSLDALEDKLIMEYAAAKKEISRQ